MADRLINWLTDNIQQREREREREKKKWRVEKDEQRQRNRHMYIDLTPPVWHFPTELSAHTTFGKMTSPCLTRLTTTPTSIPSTAKPWMVTTPLMPPQTMQWWCSPICFTLHQLTWGRGNPLELGQHRRRTTPRPQRWFNANMNTFFFMSYFVVLS